MKISRPLFPPCSAPVPGGLAKPPRPLLVSLRACGVLSPEDPRKQRGGGDGRGEANALSLLAPCPRPVVECLGMFVAISNLEPGAVSRTPVLDSRDQVLLPAGTVLSASMISTLFSRGVALVDIVSSEDAANLEDERGKARLQVVEMFAMSPKTPELQQLQRILLEHLNG